MSLVTLEHQLRTGAWYGDAPVTLDFPSRWNVTTHWPKTPPPLSEAQIQESLERPIGQQPIRELCTGRSRPVILVDDVNRPTPAARIMPLLLREFDAAGIPRANITILVARGSHGEPRPESTRLKVGQEAASSCRVLLHDPYRNTMKMGETSLGTPVHVNKEVPAADFVMGIGGVYPNNTAGFGGGAKLSLGVLDIRVISQLHRKHKGVGWGFQGPANSFRQDLEEIAGMIGLKTMIIAHVDADRELVRVRCGDYHLYYDEEVAFCRKAFRAPKPGQADVVISNAFPNDLSLTFIHMKGVYPLRYAAAGASRIAIGACSEGEGFHGVFPIVRKAPLHEPLDRLRRISLMSPGEIAEKIVGKIARTFRTNGSGSGNGSGAASGVEPTAKPKNPIWLYRTGDHSDVLPSPVQGIRTVHDWRLIVESVRKEQGGREDLNVVVYPCAPLQVLE